MKCHFPKSSLCYLYYMSSILGSIIILPAGDFEPMGTIVQQVQSKQKVGNPQNLQRRQVLSQKPNEQHLILLRVKIFHSLPPMFFELCYNNGHGLVKKLLIEPSQRDGGLLLFTDSLHLRSGSQPLPYLPYFYFCSHHLHHL